MKNLKNVRRNQNLTQQMIANALGVPTTTYATYEQNKAFPNEKTLIKLADFFGVSVDYLLGHETPNILHLDSFNENQQKAIELMKKLSDDEMFILLGYLASLTNTPLEEVVQKKM